MTFADHAWRDEESRQRPSKPSATEASGVRARPDVRFGLISLVIVIILGLQLFAGFRNPAQWGWPFVAYPMYRGAHYENERTRHDFTTYVVLADGRRAPITPDDLGMSWWRFRANIVHAIFKGDTDALQSTVDQYCGKHRAEVVGLELEDMGVIVTRSGMQDGLPPEVRATVDIKCQ